jgi:uncharacterized protein YjbI with pentapeptide repeats
MTVTEFFAAVEKGQRHFVGLYFEYEDGFSNKDFSNVTFEGCFLYLDFRNSNLSNSKFIECNIKEIDLRGADLTNSFMTKCLVESAMFKGANVKNFKFEENYYFGLTLGQDDFDTKLVHEDEHV